MEAFAASVEGWGIAEFLRRSIWAYPLVNWLHVIAIGVLVALWLTGWALGYLIVAAGVFAPGAAARPPVEEVASVIRWIGVASTVGLLLIVLGGVQLLRLVAARPNRPRSPGSAEAVPLELASVAERRLERKAG